VLAFCSLQVFLLTPYKLNAQDSTFKHLKVLPVPALGYSPETEFYFGAVALISLNFFNDTNTRSSNAKLEFNYSLRKQVIFSADWNLFSKNETWFSKGELEFSDYPALYFGIGESPYTKELSYESRRIRVQGNFLKSIFPQLFFGPALGYLGFSQIRYDSTYLITNELQEASMISTGLDLLFDSRDNILNPSKGSYAEAYWLYRWSNIPYSKLRVDLRQYVSSKDHILGIRLLQDISSSSAPFFDLSLVGGDNISRGYFRGRFRDVILSNIQIEYKSPAFWRFRIAAFGGYSNIGRDFNTLYQGKSLLNYGMGIRFLADKQENINLRFDYARGNHGLGGFYVAFGESF